MNCSCHLVVALSSLSLVCCLLCTKQALEVRVDCVFGSKTEVLIASASPFPWESWYGSTGRQQSSFYTELVRLFDGVVLHRAAVMCMDSDVVLTALGL